MNPSKYHRGFPGGWEGKESTLNAGTAGDMGPIPGSGRFPGGGHNNPLQYLCLEIAMEPSRLQSIGSQRVRHNLSNLTHTHGKVIIANFQGY